MLSGTGFPVAFPFADRAVDHFEIRQQQLGFDDVHISRGVDLPEHMADFRVLKTADHVNDRIHFADIAQKLIPKAFSLAGALNQARDVDEANDGRFGFLGLQHLGQAIQSGIGNRDDSEIAIDRREGVI